jgi:hypothetical protein
MTPANIFAEYLEMEKAANAILMGADPDVIIAILAEDVGETEDEVRRIVREFTTSRSGG